MESSNLGERVARGLADKKGEGRWGKGRRKRRPVEGQRGRGERDASRVLRGGIFSHESAMIRSSSSGNAETEERRAANGDEEKPRNAGGGTKKSTEPGEKKFLEERGTTFGNWCEEVCWLAREDRESRRREIGMYNGGVREGR